MNENELFREIVRSGILTLSPQRVNMTMLEREMAFIESRHLESYFNVAHKIIARLKWDNEFMVGPGRGWMIRSYVCWAMGITFINPESLGLEPLLTWCDENNNPIINICVDDDSFYSVYNKVIEWFGYNNVALMPAMLSDKSVMDMHNAYALLICQDGCISDYYPVQEITDGNDFKIICTKEFIAECDNKTVFRFNILKSHELTRIKRIQELIMANRKTCPQFGDRDIQDENYAVIRSGSYKGIPFFGSLQQYEINIRLLLQDSYHAEFHYLLNAMALFIKGVGQSLKSKNDVDEYQHKHGSFLRWHSYDFPWGFLYKEDVAHFLNRWISFTWKQTAHIMELIEVSDTAEIERMKQLFLQNGMENAYCHDDLQVIWDSLFNRAENGQLFSKADLAGDLYLSVFLARLKAEYREEFMQQYEEEKN